jgi:hypothetical protein
MDTGLGIPLTDLAYTTGRAADLEVASNGDIYATLGIFTRTMVLKSDFATHGANYGAAGTWDGYSHPLIPILLFVVRSQWLLLIHRNLPDDAG